MVLGWFAVELLATLGCGPGALILAVILYHVCKKVYAKPDVPLQIVIQRGMIAGSAMAFANLPGFLALTFVWEQPCAIAKVMLLFVIAGASCGMWIAWQAYRAAHPPERFWPRYSLLTLIIVVMAWGALLGVFAPPVE